MAQINKCVQALPTHHNKFVGLKVSTGNLFTGLFLLWDTQNALAITAHLSLKHITKHLFGENITLCYFSYFSNGLPDPSLNPETIVQDLEYRNVLFII